MAATSSVEKYRSAIRKHFAENKRERAAEISVGGDFVQLGDLEVNLLRMIGWDTYMSIIDIGAGSGRLASALCRNQFCGTYLGTDISAELVEFAREQTPPNYQFKLVDDFAIPERDSMADMVCFFSVFTHLLHEESFAYLTEALRVAKAGGRIVISYLDFSVPAHWPIFESTVATIAWTRPNNIFMSRCLWKAWSEKLGLRISFWQDGGVPFIPIKEPVTFESGVTRVGFAALGPIGQSVIVLEKPPARDAARP